MEEYINLYYANNAKKLRLIVDNILFKLKYNVDNEDFYSLANEIFAKAIETYDKTKNFDTFIYTCLLNKFKTEMTRRNREKRRSDKEAISINSIIGTDEKMTLEDIIGDKKTVESIYFDEKETYSYKMQKYLNRLSEQQRNVLRLISIGFTQNDIIDELHINNKEYNDCCNTIRSFRNTSILMDE